ncbi:ParB/RepB/Spo0J family partition protein [Enterobacter cloacae]|uniref:ParB/RepB/Spo0J family partition protein n=1 Tax=Enterobacteriaceae TaxID=543 RepID=UPI0028593935|nr:ParB/RepB/Spo0J family partition protein [Citrobacter freundii]HAW4281203.1 ParB/RepB/Spo0J family partition protein [Escherichia coli]HDW3531837.1 ParB/RepB/Spo0J family partition protein [Citrobacter freundii]
MNNQPEKIVLLKTSLIKIINPRSRNKFRHGEITESIDKSGLRKPITVRRIDDKDYEYALVCGQGRLEAINNLNEDMIPAFIIDIDDETAYLMSLIENMARVNPRAGEQFNRIKEMKAEGLTDREISTVTGFSYGWISSITMLIDKAENKLLAAVESGKMPISLAVEIAKTDYKGAQELFIQAFEKGEIKHKDIIKLRAILDARNEGLKGFNGAGFGYSKKKKELTTEDLTKLYQENIDSHKKIKKKALFVEGNIILAKQIFQDIMCDDSFVQLVKEENMLEHVNLIMSSKHEDF